MTLFKKETPINMFDQISLIITPCLLNPTKLIEIYQFKFFFKTLKFNDFLYLIMILNLYLYKKKCFCKA